MTLGVGFKTCVTLVTWSVLRLELMMETLEEKSPEIRAEDWTPVFSDYPLFQTWGIYLDNGQFITVACGKFENRMNVYTNFSTEFTDMLFEIIITR